MVEHLPDKVFLTGPAGTGKTTRGVERLLSLCESTRDGIMVYVPQKTLAGPYFDAIRSQARSQPEVLTIGSLAKRMVELFWPLVSAEAGFAHPDEPPVFLNLETSQYFMAMVVRPLLAEGYFETVTISRNRLYTQVLDNLNKAALNGYPIETVGTRLQLAALGEPEKTRIYRDTQAAVTRFREFCLAHNLLDFSLQLEVFWKYLWPEGTLCREYLRKTYRHLILDNLEETTPVEHDLFTAWLPDFDSALLIYDIDGGYRTFLGADPLSARQLTSLCDEIIELNESLVSPPMFELLSNRIGGVLKRPVPKQDESLSLEDFRKVMAYQSHRYFPEMLDWVAEQVVRLIEEQGVPPAEVVVLSPYLSDALRYSLSEKLGRLGLKTRSHRPSRSLRDEPVTQALVTLMVLAHPDWGMSPTGFDVAYMLVQAIEGMDLVRAQLLAEIVFRTKDGRPTLSAFAEIKPEMQERITYTFGERFDRLREWLAAYQSRGWDEPDFFLGRLFGELLSQPGYGFHTRLQAGETTANLIDSIQNFRWVAGDQLEEDQSLGAEFILMLQEGVIAAQYLRSWRDDDPEAVLLAPAYTYLMRNQPVEYQFWLDVASYGWGARIDQPVTHPYVLSRNWPDGRYWTDADEVEVNQDALYRLVTGLLRRCRKQVFLGLSDLSETGYESEGELIKAIQRILQGISVEGRRG
jgi:hypothetical protein